MSETTEASLGASASAPGTQGAGALVATPSGPEPGPRPSLEAPPEPENVGERPSFVFFGIVSAVSLIADIATKAWAEVVLSKRTLLDPAIEIIEGHLGLTLAYNRGGAWGLLQNASESVRRPFFLIVSVAAIAFIVSLYGRLGSGQRALKWGLPLVLGGALGNLSDRITRSSVIDFIDFRANWVGTMNEIIARVFGSWTVTDHWPTFNVADISICVGVGLMAVDMVTSRRRPREEAASPGAEPAASLPTAPVATSRVPTPEPQASAAPPAVSDGGSPPAA